MKQIWPATIVTLAILSAVAAWIVIAGEHQINAPDPYEQISAAKQIIIHGDYNSSLIVNDIALVKLSKPANLNDYVNVVCLPTDLEPSSNKAYITGFGAINSTHYPNVLQQTEISLIDQSTCKRPDYYGRLILEHMMCAGEEEGGTGICFGDSGGPLVVKEKTGWVQYGISSWIAEPCGGPKSPGVFTRVADYVPWIKETISRQT